MVQPTQSPQLDPVAASAADKGRLGSHWAVTPASSAAHFIGIYVPSIKLMDVS